MKVNWLLETGFAGCDLEGAIEFADDVSEEEIEEAVREEAFGCISLTWWKDGDDE